MNEGIEPRRLGRGLAGGRAQHRLRKNPGSRLGDLKESWPKSKKIYGGLSGIPRAVAARACLPSTSLRENVDAIMLSEKNQATHCTHNMIPIWIVEIKEGRREGEIGWGRERD